MAVWATDSKDADLLGLFPCRPAGLLTLHGQGSGCRLNLRCESGFKIRYLCL
jgi:hypothetical protein